MSYIVTQQLLVSFLPVYIRVNPDNVFDLKPDYLFVFGYCSLVAFQIWILYI